MCPRCPALGTALPPLMANFGSTGWMEKSSMMLGNYTLAIILVTPTSEFIMLTFQGGYTQAQISAKKTLSWTILYKRNFLYISLNGPAKSFLQRWFEPVWIGLQAVSNQFANFIQFWDENDPYFSICDLFWDFLFGLKKLANVWKFAPNYQNMAHYYSKTAKAF